MHFQVLLNAMSSDKYVKCTHRTFYSKNALTIALQLMRRINIPEREKLCVRNQIHRNQSALYALRPIKVPDSYLDIDSLYSKNLLQFK